MKALCLGTLLLIATAARSMAACDPTSIAGVTYGSDADSVVVQDPYRSFAHSTMGYDFHSGRLFGHCSACYEVADVKGSDSYRIEGAPPGVEIPIHIELRVDMAFLDDPLRECGDYCGQNSADGIAAIYSGGSADSLYECFCGHGMKSVGLNLVVMPDEDFVVRYRVGEWVGRDGTADPGRIEGTIHFSYLPAGAQLVSCHGVNDEAVATLPATWGRLKATYR